MQRAEDSAQLAKSGDSLRHRESSLFLQDLFEGAAGNIFLNDKQRPVPLYQLENARDAWLGVLLKIAIHLQIVNLQGFFHIDFLRFCVLYQPYPVIFVEQSDLPVIRQLQLAFQIHLLTQPPVLGNIKGQRYDTTREERMKEPRKDSTSSLLEVLRSAHPEDIVEYHRRYLQGKVPTFASWVDEIIESKGMTRQEIFQQADIPQKYGYKLLAGEKHTTDRDKLLRLFFAMGLELPQAQRGLELYGLAALYPRKKRDAILIIAFNRGISWVDQVDDLLIQHGEPPLSRCRD